MSKGGPRPESMREKLSLRADISGAPGEAPAGDLTQLDQQTCNQLPPPEPSRVPPLLLPGSNIEYRERPGAQHDNDQKTALPAQLARYQLVDIRTLLHQRMRILVLTGTGGYLIVYILRFFRLNINDPE